jgi:hypothetical protein
MYNEQFFTEAGFFELREVPGKGLCGLYRMIFTVGLCYNMQEDEFDMYEGRYCFPSLLDAKTSLHEWDGSGDPPGNWIKHKGKREYSNPKL